MNRVAKVGLGCLLVPVGATVLAVLFFLSMKAAGVPDPEPRAQEFTQEIGPQLERPSSTSMERTDDANALLPQATAVIVDIDVEECVFFLESGPAEDGVRVEANYDEATYELTRSYDMEGDTPVFRLKFESTISFWRRIAQDGSIDDSDLEMNEITVFLPEDTLIALRAKIAKAEGEMLLDGLALTSLSTECRMGEFTVTMEDPNAVEMDEARIAMSMGEGTFRGLSNLRARSIDVEGSMGEFRLDFGNSLLTDTSMRARMKMGELSIEVPDDALYDPASKVKATMGEVSNGLRSGQRINDPELAKRISLDAAILMGEIRLDPFRARRVSPVSDR